MLYRLTHPEALATQVRRTQMSVGLSLGGIAVALLLTLHLGRALQRLHFLCAALLHHSYPRLTRPPLNAQVDEVLGAVVERLLKALREARPPTVRQFFGLASQHIPGRDCYVRRPSRRDVGRLRHILPAGRDGLPATPADANRRSRNAIRRFATSGVAPAPDNGLTIATISAAFMRGRDVIVSARWAGLGSASC